jgi:chromate transporter
VSEGPSYGDGPVVIAVAFIGCLVAGPARATVAAFGSFLSCYLFVILPALHFRKYSKNIHVRAFVTGVTAAATGAIAGAAFVLGRRAITDRTTVAIALFTLLLVLKFKKVPEPLVILSAGVMGSLLTRY